MVAIHETVDVSALPLAPKNPMSYRETMRALRNFQQFEGLVASGEPNPRTLEALDLGFEQQEFFGISPEFGQEQGLRQKPQQQQMGR